MTDILSMILFASATVGGLVILAILSRQSKKRAITETARQLSNLRAPSKEEVLESMKSGVLPRPEHKLSRLSDGDRKFLEALLKSKAMDSDTLRNTI